MSGDFPVQLVTRLVGRRSAAVYSAARLSVCRVILQIPQARHARHPREDVPCEITLMLSLANQLQAHLIRGIVNTYLYCSMNCYVL